MNKSLFLLCIISSGVLATTNIVDPYKEMKEERYKYMKLYADEKRKQAEYERQVPELDLRNMSNFYLTDKMLDAQINYYKTLSLSLFNGKYSVSPPDIFYKTQYYKRILGTEKVYEYTKLSQKNISENKFNLYKKRHEYLKKNVPLLKVKFIKLMNDYVELLKENELLKTNKKRLLNYINKEVEFINVETKRYSFSILSKYKTYDKSQYYYSGYFNEPYSPNKPWNKPYTAIEPLIIYSKPRTIYIGLDNILVNGEELEKS